MTPKHMPCLTCCIPIYKSSNNKQIAASTSHFTTKIYKNELAQYFSKVLHINVRIQVLMINANPFIGDVSHK